MMLFLYNLFEQILSLSFNHRIPLIIIKMLLTSKTLSQTQASAGQGTVILGPPDPGPTAPYLV